MANLVCDPVCGELIDWENAAIVLNHHGSFQFFCSLNCCKKFRLAPNRFVQK